MVFFIFSMSIFFYIFFCFMILWVMTSGWLSSATVHCIHCCFWWNKQPQSWKGTDQKTHRWSADAVRTSHRTHSGESLVVQGGGGDDLTRRHGRHWLQCLVLGSLVVRECLRRNLNVRNQWNRKYVGQGRFGMQTPSDWPRPKFLVLIDQWPTFWFKI